MFDLEFEENVLPIALKDASEARGSSEDEKGEVLSLCIFREPPVSIHAFQILCRIVAHTC